MDRRLRGVALGSNGNNWPISTHLKSTAYLCPPYLNDLKVAGWFNANLETIPPKFGHFLQVNPCPNGEKACKEMRDDNRDHG